MRLWPRRKSKKTDAETSHAVGIIEQQQIEKESTAASTHRPVVMSEKMAALRAATIDNLFPKMPNFQIPEGAAMDSSFAMDDCFRGAYTRQPSILPDNIFAWYIGQSFIGWQSCAILAQHWLILKACLMPAKDAAQGGWRLTANDGTKITPAQLEEFAEADKKYQVMKNLVESHQFREVFGIRHVLFLFDGIDYTKPFNPDGIKPNSYRGMSQIDPYWMSPWLDPSAVSSPGNKDFYEPTYWMISGQKYHKSHFVILRGPEVADVLKPSYMYGGSPLPQRIYERVYAAERTANEAPELAMTKRLTVRSVDLAAFIANQEVGEQALQIASAYRNNYGTQLIGTDEELNQLETSLTDLDAVIMTQYQLVAAIAEVPATKLMGTSPKGFGASGDYEIQSYHEKLSGIQENDYARILERHYQALIKSEIKGVTSVAVVFNPLQQLKAKEIAEVNKLNADTDVALQNAGAIDGYDIRTRLASDENSGYAGIEMSRVLEEGGGEEDINADDNQGKGNNDGGEAEATLIPK